MAGFALPEYVVPKNGADRSIVGGTMPKASTEAGGMLGEIKKMAKNPGPEQYNKDHLSKSFADCAKGGKFSKLAREYPKGNMRTPAVGHYDTVSAMASQTPRLKGGLMAKTERGCLFYDQAVQEGKWKQAPGKYEGNKLAAHQTSPRFQQTITESRHPKKPNGVGPGYYTMDYKHIDKSVPVYSSSRETTKSYLDQHVRGQDKAPGPGHNGIAEAKNEDRDGRRKHATRLLGDRIVTPRLNLATAA